MKGNRIPNSQRRERSVEALQAAANLNLAGHGGRKLRSLTAVYNCVGMVFASRRTCIEPEHVRKILSEDDYHVVGRAADVVPGDVVVYELDGEVSHVALVISNEPRIAEGESIINVISQWGSDGEYQHEYRDVPLLLGTPVRFYSERRI